jgi:hypothetical protein
VKAINRQLNRKTQENEQAKKKRWLSQGNICDDPATMNLIKINN